MNTKQLTYPTIQEQQEYWINKEAQSNNATPETRDIQLKAITEALWNYHYALDTLKHGGLAAAQLVSEVEIALDKPWIRGATLNVAYNPQLPVSNTADPKPKDDDLSRTESLTDWYDHGRNDFDRGDLQE